MKVIGIEKDAAGVAATSERVEMLMADGDPVSADMMVTDASISNQPRGACDVSPGNLSHECAIRASRPPFLARKRPFMPIFAPKQAI